MMTDGMSRGLYMRASSCGSDFANIPGIPKAYAYQSLSSEGVDYLVMELLGPSLRSFMYDKLHPLDKDPKKRVEEAEEEPRDLRPADAQDPAAGAPHGVHVQGHQDRQLCAGENDEGKKEPKIYLIDFGSAALVRKGMKPVKNPHPTGTPRYASRMRTPP
jgi:serine/threonine protein kinase